MAGKKIMMSPTSQLMLHNCSAFGEGDHKEMSKTSEVLKTIDKTISNAYMIKTGKTQGEVLKLMDKETWLSPEDAKQHGFIDEVMFEQEILFVASANFSGLLSQETLTKVRNLMADKENKNSSKKSRNKTKIYEIKRRSVNGFKRLQKAKTGTIKSSRRFNKERKKEEANDKMAEVKIRQGKKRGLQMQILTHLKAQKFI